jgi:AAA+ superfamily predicted ATPase
MASNEVTRHLIIDIKTGFAYGIKMDGEGNCKAVQPLNSSIESLDGRVVSKFGPLLSQNDPFGGKPANANTLPYGKTTYAVEMTEDGKTGQMFTIVWPEKAEADKGVLPIIAHKELPDDLVKAGIAPRPAVKQGKGAGVDDEETLKEALANIDGMIGLESAKRDIKQNIAVARFNRMKEELGLATKSISRHMVFTGNPGTGKTTFAREVAKVYHALGFIEKPEVHEVKREDLVAGFVGQTALKTKEQIDKAKGGILFIDEAYALSRDAAGGGDSKDFGREAIDTLVAAMENMREDLIVIVAGYPEPMKRFIDANEGLKSRFMTYLSFEDYNLPQLGQIMDVMLKDRGYTMTDEARALSMQLIDEEQKRAKKDFGNGRTVRNLVEKAEKELAMRLEGENKLGKNHGLSEADLKKELTTLTLADIQAIDLSGLSNLKAPSKGETGFGFKVHKEAANANDGKPSASAQQQPAALKKKPSAKAQFGR